MFNWIHHLLEPHCLECKEEREEKVICQSCETLKAQLEIVNYEKKMLLERIIELSKPETKSNIEIKMPDFESIKPRTIPWNVRQQMLEAEDRKQAQLLRTAAEAASKARDIPRGNSGGLTADITQQESIEKLEAELGIEQGAS